MRSTLLTATPLLTALVWTVALVVDKEPFSAASALLLGIGMLAMCTVATVGMIIVGGRWAHRLGLGLLGVTAIVAMLRDIDFVWIVGTTATAVALLALLSLTVVSTIRKLPSASGPPPSAITPPLLLLGVPVILGLVGGEATPWALLLIGLAAPIAAFLYSRVIPGGLLGIRLIWPLMTLALTPLLGWVAGLVAGGLAVSVAITAWNRSVKSSYHPPREAGTTLPIPPELAPGEILDAAQIDDRGRRK